MVRRERERALQGQPRVPRLARSAKRNPEVEVALDVDGPLRDGRFTQPDRVDASGGCGTPAPARQHHAGWT